MAHLCQTPHCGTKVYRDRLFTSIQDAEQMRKELYMTGTVMKNLVAAAVQKSPTDKSSKTQEEVLQQKFPLRMESCV